MEEELIKDPVESYPQPLKTKLKFNKKSVNIYSGEFEISDGKDILIVDGKVEFKWRDSLGVNFEGRVISTTLNNFSFVLFRSEKFELKFDGIIIGKVRINHYSCTKEFYIKGIIPEEAIYKAGNFKFSTIEFVIPNFKKKRGTFIQDEINEGNNRLTLKNDLYEVIIDASFDHESISKRLLVTGEIFPTHLGKIIKINSEFNELELINLIERLASFVSFLNGNWTSPMLIHGVQNKKINYIDYTKKKISSFEESYHWWDWTEELHISKMWDNLVKFDDAEYKVLNSAIEWYLESQNSNLNIESQLIIVQSGLELMFNWLIVEKKQMFFGDDVDKLHAFNKIRLLLSQLNVPTSIPNGMPHLPKWINDSQKNTNKLIVDGPTAITELRNSLIHPRFKNREKLDKIDNITRSEILRLARLYLELSILFCLGYSGRFKNICNYFIEESENYYYVPWIIGQNK